MSRPPPAVSHIKDLTPDPANRRAHNPRNLGMVVDALQKVGAARSIVIDEDNVILAGNGVTEAAAEAGITKLRIIDAAGDELIAVRRTGLTEDQKRYLAIADNRTAELATWDVDQLKADLDAGLDFTPFFSADELDAILHAVDPGVAAGKTDPDDVPAERSTGIVAGDLFELGAHRLLCGDCTVAEDVARLMGAEKSALVFTDPPYGVAYTGGRNPTSNTPRRQLIGDEAADLYLPVLLTTRDFCTSRAPLYLWFSGTHGAEAYAAVLAAGYTVRALLVWNKLDAHYGNFMAQYMNKHEPFLYCVRESPPWLGPTNEVTVWDVKQPARNEFHPTQKPVELAQRAIQNSLPPAGLVADWFLGSGSTLIAAEQTSRHCVGLELEPSYCQVIIDRWEAFNPNGAKAVKVGEAIRA